MPPKYQCMKVRKMFDIIEQIFLCYTYIYKCYIYLFCQYNYSLVTILMKIPKYFTKGAKEHPNLLCE